MKESYRIHEKTISAEWDQYMDEPIQTRVDMSYKTLFSAIKNGVWYKDSKDRSLIKPRHGHVKFNDAKTRTGEARHV